MPARQRTAKRSNSSSGVWSLEYPRLDVVLANWRGVVAPPNINAEDKRVLKEAVAKVAKSETWKKILNERG